MRWPLAIAGTVCVLAAVTLLALPMILRYKPPPPATLPVLAAAPAFTLIDQSGGTFDSAALQGRVWVADFMFTTCPAICPILSTNMARVQRSLVERGYTHDARLVSVSVDPDHDTPEVLTTYAERFGADPALWTFLTGEREAIWALCREGFRLHVDEATDPGAAMPIQHEGRFVLVDRAGQVRGYYDGTDPAAVDLLLEDLPRLVDEPAP